MKSEITLPSYKRQERQVRETTEKLKEVLTKEVNGKTLPDRMGCIYFCMGYLKSAGYNFIPCELIDYINELYFDEKIKA